MNVEEKKSFINEVIEVAKSLFMMNDKEKEDMAEVPEAIATDPPVDPMAELQTMYDAAMAENADLKEKLATMQAKDVEDATTLETMKSEKAKAENDLAVFKAEKLAIVNLPKPKEFAEMTSLEKYRESKKNQ
jgi:hypothetical protein